MSRLLGFLFYYLCTNLAHSQTLEHAPIWSQGEVPKAFLENTEDILASVEDNESSEEFDIASRISIKEMLESGIILFGDSVSQYIQSVGQRILERNNITDDRYISGGTPLVDVTETAGTVYNQPRTYGVEAAYTW